MLLASLVTLTAAAASCPQFVGNLDRFMLCCSDPEAGIGLSCDSVAEPSSELNLVFDLYLNGIDEVAEIYFGWEVTNGDYADRCSFYFAGNPEERSEDNFAMHMFAHEDGGCHSMTEDGMMFLFCTFAYSDDSTTLGTFAIRPHPDLGVARVVGCNGDIYDIPEEDLPVFGFNGAPGQQDCLNCDDPVPVDAVSWSELKFRY